MTLDIDLSDLTTEQTIGDVCYAILKRAGKPLHYRKITELLLQIKPLETIVEAWECPRRRRLKERCSARYFRQHNEPNSCLG